MKKKYRILFSMSLFFSTALFAESQVRNAADLKITTSPAQKDSYRSEPVKNGDGKEVIRFTKTAPENFCEFSFNPALKLPNFDRLSVVFHLGEADPLSNFSLRLIDADREILQYTLYAPKTGNGTICFEIDRNASPTGSWEKKKNGKIDFPVSLLGGTFRFQKGKGTLELRSLETEVLKPYAMPPSVRPRLPASGLALWDPADKTAELMIENVTEAPVKADISFAVTDLNGKVLEERNSVCSLKGGECIGVPFTIPAGYGVYTVRYKSVLADGKKEMLEGSFRFASMVPAKKGERTRGEFLFGICSQHLIWFSPEMLRKEIAAIAAAGAGIVRFCSYWDVVEKRENIRDFSSLDRVFDTLEEYGLKSQVLHSRLPAWAVSREWKPVANREKPGRALPDFKAWQNFNRTFAERYAERCSCIEIWNEPDLYQYADFTTDDYLKLLNAAAEEIRKAAPKVKILSAGFASVPTPAWTGGNPDIVRRTVAEGKNDYDIFALHNHGTLPSCGQNLERYRDLQKRYGDAKTFYITEAGLSTRNYSEMVQAMETFRKPLFYWSRGGMAYNWYSIRNAGNNRRNNEHNFGLLLADYQPKPSYVTYNMLTTLYGRAKFIRTVADHDKFTLLEFQNGEDRLFADWNNLHSYQKQIVAFSGVSGKASVVDLFGNERPLPVRNGTVHLEIGEYPSTLKISGQPDVPVFCGEAVRFNGGTIFVRGRKGEVSLELFNPSGEEQRTRFRFETSRTLKIVPESGTVQIPAHSSRKIALQVFAENDHETVPSDRLLLASDGLPEEGLPVPFEFVRTPSAAGFPSVPDFTLDNVGQLSVLVPSEQEFAPYVWNGPSDLSAKVFLMLNRNEFKIRIEVTDDVHSQKFSGTDLWKGDSVQFAIIPVGSGYTWRFGLSRRSNASPEVFLWTVPRGKTIADSLAKTRLTTSRDEEKHKTLYEVSMPSEMLGIDGRPFRFNLLVNDNDGELRESFISAAPGYGREWTPNAFPLLKMKDAE